jgi:hypothetical protein
VSGDHVEFFIFRIGSDESVRARLPRPRWVNIWGWTVLMAVSAVALFVVAALGK